MIHIQGLADPESLIADNFGFHVGNTDDPDTWVAALLLFVTTSWTSVYENSTLLVRAAGQS